MTLNIEHDTIFNTNNHHLASLSTLTWSDLLCFATPNFYNMSRVHVAVLLNTFSTHVPASASAFLLKY